MIMAACLAAVKFYAQYLHLIIDYIFFPYFLENDCAYTTTDKTKSLYQPVLIHFLNINVSNS